MCEVSSVKLISSIGVRKRKARRKEEKALQELGLEKQTVFHGNLAGI